MQVCVRGAALRPSTTISDSGVDFRSNLRPIWLAKSGSINCVEAPLSIIAEAAITKSSDPSELAAYLKAALDIMAILKAGFEDSVVARTSFVCRTGRQCAWQYPDAKATEFLVQSIAGLCSLSQVFPRIICQPANLVT